MITRVLAFGQAVAGDDGVGVSVLNALSRDAAKLPDTVELAHLQDASQLLLELDGADQVILIDAVVGARAPGTVRVLSPNELSQAPMTSVSSHGLGVAQALELARVLAAEPTGPPDRADRPAPRIRVVAISIDQPARYSDRLSPAVEQAVPRAVEIVRDMLEMTATEARSNLDPTRPA